jgi:hypothetical protein
MAGFGAGAFVLALADRASREGPACGAYFDEAVTDAGVAPVDSGVPAQTAGVDGGEGDGTAPDNCGCSGSGATVMTLITLSLLFAISLRRFRT